MVLSRINSKAKKSGLFESPLQLTSLDIIVARTLNS